ncbi:MAG TPA: hypothetical protein VMQ59_06525, partial [Acidimicrobiales bacterium]|nr:hypothetical protein [Acidimicrobiales bacterium]
YYGAWTGAPTDIHYTWTSELTQSVIAGTENIVQSAAFLSQTQTFNAYPEWPGTTSSGNVPTGFNVLFGYSWTAGWYAETPGNPSAATLVSPPSGGYVDATQSFPYEATYNSVNGQAANGYMLRVKASGGGYFYWTGSAWTSTEPGTWPTCSVLPGGLFTVAPTHGLTNGPVNSGAYQFSIAFQEAGGNLQGPFATDMVFNTNPAPVVTAVTAPPASSTQNVPNPSVTWTVTFTGATQAGYEIFIYTDAQWTAGGFVPGVGPNAWSSGLVASTSDSVATTAMLTTGNNYRAYVQVTDSRGEMSAMGASGTYSQFNVLIEDPAAPTLNVVANNDPTTGCPQVLIAATGNDNLLGNNTAGFNTTIGTWTATNATLTLDGTHTLEGSYALAIQPVATGAVTLTTGLYEFTGPAVATMLSMFRNSLVGTIPVTMSVLWYNSVGSPVGVPQSLSPLSVSDTAFTPFALVATPVPVGATQFAIQLTFTASSLAVNFWVDEAGAFESSTVPSWSAGGFVGHSALLLQSSPDGVNWNGVNGLTDAALPSPSQYLTAIDRTAPPNLPTFYRAAVIGTPTSGGTFQSAWTNGGPVTPNPNAQWWLQIPGQLGSAVGFNLSTDAQPKPKEVGTVNYVLGDPLPTKVTDGFKGRGGILPIRVVSITSLLAMRQLIEQPGTLLLSGPDGSVEYIQHDPQTDPIEATVYNTVGLGENAYTNITFNYIAAPAP